MTGLDVSPARGGAALPGADASAAPRGEDSAGGPRGGGGGGGGGGGSPRPA